MTTRAFTGTQVRAAERPLLEAGQGPALMRRAAWGLAEHVAALLRDRGRVAGATVAALVGPGNNGGDALFALAFLRARGVEAVAVAGRPGRDGPPGGHAAGGAARPAAG
ncbi:NAD(P)H-hydrate epimerase, partial [Micrococcus sp.]|uniref:NAD(P)H-hydrate epimerase n=1 Tax=Micrococcus sp. TaxID=1271 RepID=UPI002A91EC81